VPTTYFWQPLDPAAFSLRELQRLKDKRHLMTTVILLVLLGTISVALAQGWLIRQLRNRYLQPVAPWPASEPMPKAAVLLSLRGNDPFLTSCLRNLLSQDYPDFIVKIVIDSESDPAWESIRAIRAEGNAERLVVSILRERSSTCSLKNSSVIQSINSLPEDIEVVALVDADAVTHPTWLRELVAPLADPQVACSTGIRWFAPQDQSLASRMRCYWNILAASVIHISRTPWGGSMVVRRSVLDSGLTEEWSRMFCEDAFTTRYLDERKLQIVCVPQATVVNEETTSLSGCIRFVNRQMLIFKLYHRQWWGVVGMIAATLTVRLPHLYFMCQAALAADWISTAILFAIHPIIRLVTHHEAMRLDREVRKMMASNAGREIACNPKVEVFGFICTEIMFFMSFVYAISTRTVQWRGITYRVRGPKDITLLAYRPFEEIPSYGVAAKATVV
jgi:cellulose synthase/poly-beta-1,6-N-acetylglucosamine synthase-like glycosyltransferase